jgi:hypothetical protein
MVDDSTSCVCSHGPEYLIVGGEPGGTAGLSRSKNDAIPACVDWVYVPHAELIVSVRVQRPNKRSGRILKLDPTITTRPANLDSKY